ncbi:MAG: BRCT domain-containing protein, partial [Deltaproteobacteria bacterium]|nr:BRCT domain-containing protein [Deltaproteobacteria bacterium]
VESVLIPKEKMQNLFQRFFSEREGRDYETDGVVYKVDSLAEQNRLGFTAHHPRYAIAYKFQGDSGETMLREVIWSVSRTGTITPVGHVDPVILSGASVTRVSLHNVGLAKKMGITIPAKVRMVRRGGVIPNIEEVLEGKGKPLSVPKKCPSCGAPTELREDFLYCTNSKSCLVSKIGELDHFVKVIGIDGFGRKHLQQLYEKGLVEDPADFYTLTVEDLSGLERMGEKLATKLVANIADRKKLPLDLFLRALGIQELGKHVSKILSEFGTLDKIVRLMEEELSEIHTVGETIAAHVVQGLKEKKPLIDKLLKFVTLEKGVAAKAKQGPLSGKSFLFTGAMLSMTRTEAQKKVEELGGTAANSVSKTLDYLVVGDGGGAGSKLDKAKKLQQSGATIQIISENQFKQLLHS